MPGPSNTPIKPPLSDAERAVCAALRQHVEMLAGVIGIRHDSRPSSLDATVAYITQQFQTLGQSVSVETYPTARWEAKNLVVEWPGITNPEKVVIVGAHYDTVRLTPGADDNASAVAALLAICNQLRGQRFAHTLRFVAFANEEPPHFVGPTMGSRVYADACRERGDDIAVMVCLEMLGYYDTGKTSQNYPDELPRWLRKLLPSRGDFIAFVADMPTRRSLSVFTRAFKSSVRFPVVSKAIPRSVVDFWLSDHGPFWDAGYPAFMVTDTSYFRNAHYHEPTDLPDTLDYERMARLTMGLAAGVAKLAKPV